MRFSKIFNFWKTWPLELTGDFRTPNHTTCPLILGRRTAHDQDAEGIVGTENEDSVFDSRVD